MPKKTTNILFYSGFVLLFIGTLGLTFAAFFAFIGLPIFIIGAILVLISRNKTWNQRLIPVGLCIIGIIAFWPIWRAINTVGPEIFIIPENYRGRVNIIFKKGCGNHLERTKEGMVYQIPDDGILFLDNKLKTGFIDHKYFFVDSNGNRTEIPKMDASDFNEEWALEKNPQEPPRNKLGIFHW